MTVIRNRYALGDRASGLECKDPSRTKQSFAKDADINNIMAKYAKTGILVDPALAIRARKAQYGDFSTGTGFQEIQDQLVVIRTVFDQLPADVRKALDNDPARMVDFMSDPENEAECVKLGLIPSKPIASPAGAGAPGEEGEAAPAASGEAAPAAGSPPA